jgi:2-haloacid dehalogenase
MVDAAMAAESALAFDMYGTLVDPIRIWRQLEGHLGASALRAAEVWRMKQLEYTFRLTAMQRYEDFLMVTAKALDYALLAVGHDLDVGQRRALVAQYDSLEPFPDVEAGLEQLSTAGYVMAVVSNGTPPMLRAIVQSAGLDRWLPTLISVDEVGVYKPAPRVYHHAAERLGLPLSKIRLISSNPFDVIGAAAAGMEVAWLNRSGGLFDTLAPPPDVVVSSLTELAERLRDGM